MEKIARWKSNKDVDPDYPYYSRRAEDGTIYYSVPMEAPNDIPMDEEADDADKLEYSYLPLLGGKNLRVYCWETTDREWALRIRRMINTSYAQERRYSTRYIVVPEVFDNGLNDGNRKVGCTSSEEPEEPTGEDRESAEQAQGRRNSYEQQNQPDVENQILDRIEIQTIQELVKNTDSRYWEVFYQLRLYGYDAKTIADRMGISVQRVYQLADKVRKIAEKTRREND